MKSTAKPNYSARALRRALRAEFGSRKYRVTSDNEVHVYGPMPNAAHIIGWRLYGYANDPQTLRNLGAV
jgi:hypothetical protein